MPPVVCRHSKKILVQSRRARMEQRMNPHLSQSSCLPSGLRVRPSVCIYCSGVEALDGDTLQLENF